MLRDIGEYEFQMKEAEGPVMMMMVLIAQPELLRQVLEEQSSVPEIENMRSCISAGVADENWTLGTNGRCIPTEFQMKEAERLVMMMALIAQLELLRQVLEEQSSDPEIENTRSRISVEGMDEN
ncbi:hypothetical protein Dimus_005526 [Dionaea muscipula]